MNFTIDIRKTDDDDEATAKRKRLRGKQDMRAYAIDTTRGA